MSYIWNTYIQNQIPKVKPLFLGIEEVAHWFTDTN